MSKIIEWPVVPRPVPQTSLIARLSEFQAEREASKRNVQALTGGFKVSTWRTSQLCNAMVWCDRMTANQNGGKEWVLQALDELKQYVEGRK